MLRSIVLFAVLAVSTVSATNLGVLAGFPSPDLSNLKLDKRAPVAGAAPYIAGFPVPNV